MAMGAAGEVSRPPQASGLESMTRAAQQAHLAPCLQHVAPEARAAQQPQFAARAQHAMADERDARTARWRQAAEAAERAARAAEAAPWLGERHRQHTRGAYESLMLAWAADELSQQWWALARATGVGGSQ